MPINLDKTLEQLTIFNQLTYSSDHSHLPRDAILHVAKDKDGRTYVQITYRSQMSLWEKIKSIFGRSDFNFSNVLEVLNQAERQGIPLNERNIMYKASGYLWQNIENEGIASGGKWLRGVIKKAADAMGLSKPSGDVRSKLWMLRRAEVTVGLEQWEKNKFAVNDVPKLPDNIDEILQGPCPYFEGKKVHETSRLILIPAGLSIDEIEKRHKCDYAFPEDVQKIAKVDKSYWALVTTEVIPGSAEGKTFEDQKALLKQGDRAPTVLEAITMNAMCHLEGGTYTNTDETYTDLNLIGEGSTEYRWSVKNLLIDALDADLEFSKETGILAARKLS